MKKLLVTIFALTLLLHTQNYATAQTYSDPNTSPTPAQTYSDPNTSPTPVNPERSIQQQQLIAQYGETIGRRINELITRINQLILQTNVLVAQMLGSPPGSIEQAALIVELERKIAELKTIEGKLTLLILGLPE